MKERIKIGISACLLGERVRYDGRDSLDHYLRYTMGSLVEWIPVCPEVGCGLPVPREPMQLVGHPENPRLITKYTGKDYTELMNRWLRREIKRLRKEQICGFVFKSRSPSSGLRGVRIKTPDGRILKGYGLFAKAVMENFPDLPVEDNERMYNPAIRRGFFMRACIYRRWKDMLKGGMKKSSLRSFHEAHKLTLMAHGPGRLKEMEELLYSAKKSSSRVVFRQYYSLLMETLKLKCTVRKNYNVLKHILSYLKCCTPDEMRALKKSMDDYRRGEIPLIVPVTLINHFAEKYGLNYLRKQYYLNTFIEPCFLD